MEEHAESPSERATYESKAMVAVHRMNVHTIKVIIPTLKQEQKLPKSLMIKSMQLLWVKKTYVQMKP